jgi:hypothetical protein
MIEMQHFGQGIPADLSIRITMTAKGHIPIRLGTMVFALCVRVETASAQPNFSYSRPTVEQRILDPLPETKPAPPTVNGYAVHNEIDNFIAAGWSAHKLRPVALCSDEDFVRRIYLDVAGVIPSAEQVVAFLKGDKRNRRRELIDQLLGSHRYADHWAAFWGDLLREQTQIRGGEQGNFRDYIRASLEANQPYDRWVAEMITATGTDRENPAANFVLRHENMSEELTITITQSFLGTQMKCAQCHDHPFDVWTHDEFKGMQGFWSGTQIRPVVRRGLDEPGQVIPPIFEVVQFRRGQGEFLTGAESGEGRGPAGLADWVVSPKNPYFARAAVNRLWAKVMGKGIVDPVDGFSVIHEPSHPEMLDWLAIEFIESGHDLKHVLRLILNSRTYLLTSQPQPQRTSGEVELFHGARLRRMTAEQLYDSIIVSCGMLDRGTSPAVEQSYPASGNSFLATFGSHDRKTVYERETTATIPQALELLNGDFVNNAVTLHANNPVQRWIDQKLGNGEIALRLYLNTLSRKPTAAERRRVLGYVGRAMPERYWPDVHWALINTREFMYIR